MNFLVLNLVEVFFNPLLFLLLFFRPHTRRRSRCWRLLSTPSAIWLNAEFFHTTKLKRFCSLFMAQEMLLCNCCFSLTLHFQFIVRAAFVAM